jgi:uncharacterized protein (TIGR02145 family)
MRKNLSLLAFAVVVAFFGLTGTTTANTFVCGDADANGMVNISDAVYLVGFIFAGGPAPNPEAAGDVDGNGFVNISDAVYLIAYIFGGGPEPNCPNQLPVLAAIGPRSVNEGAVLNFSTSATDPDGTIPAMTAVGLPTNAVYVDNLNGTGTFSFSPNFTQAGVYNVIFIASDGSLADSEVVAITVNNVNRAPVLATIGPRSVNEGATLNFSTSAIDPDGTIPAMTVVGLPTNATYVDNLNGSGTFSFSPNFTQAGVYNVTFIASDGFLADSEVVAITVNNVNRVPVLAAIGAQVVSEGANLNFIASATDPDGTIPAMTAVGLPTNATYVDNLNGTGTFSFSPNFTQAGVYNVTFIASDGFLADSEVVAITVNNVNQSPELTTDAVTGITGTTAECGGNITSDGGATVTARGVCWSINSTPTISDNITTDGAGTGNFTSSMTGLTGTTPYYVRAYATNSVGTSYGDEVAFTTVHETGTVTDIDGNIYQTVKIGNQWWMAENLKVIRYRNGNAIPYITDRTTWANINFGAYCNYHNDVSIVATFGRLYNWYAVVDVNNIAPAGWHVPTETEWQTLLGYLGGSGVAGGKMKEAGTAHWSSPNTGATNESGFTALGGGYRYTDGYYYNLGSTADFWSATQSGGSSAWGKNLGYNFVHVNSYSRSFRYGFSVRCVKDADVVPTLTTAAVSEIMETTAECGGNITSDGGATVTARGVCWSTNPTPTVSDSKTTDGAGTGSFISSITGLTAGTLYYVRAYATNSVGSGYGDTLSFTTAASSGTVTDIDGNVYQTVTIGTQVWMAENLKVTHYRNGDTIPNVTDGFTWWNLTTGAYCDYNNDVNNVATYGRLYNWYAAVDSRNIAPIGWHVASDAEWKQLEMYLGMSQAEADANDWRGTTEGGKMKETGITHWASPNTGATNESGLLGLPGGERRYSGEYYYIGYDANFWSSTEYYSPYGWYRFLGSDSSEVGRSGGLKAYGYSVRCVRD